MNKERVEFFAMKRVQVIRILLLLGAVHLVIAQKQHLTDQDKDVLQWTTTKAKNDEEMFWESSPAHAGLESRLQKRPMNLEPVASTVTTMTSTTAKPNSKLTNAKKKLLLMQTSIKKMNPGKETSDYQQSSSTLQQPTTTTTRAASSRTPHEQHTCPPSQFRCNDGRCIPEHWKCDFRIDCEDGSDESSDCLAVGSCSAGQFRCKYTNRCIPNQWLCDGDYDCWLTENGHVEDRSDEENEHCFANKTCSPNQSLCAHGVCLDIDRFCDGKRDCANDEDNCVGTQHLCINLNCAHNCKVTPDGPKCFCAKGQRPANGNQCVDLDECEMEGVCDQLCENTPGSFKCSCVPGYTKVGGNRCQAINVPKEEPPSMIVLTQTNLQRFQMNGELWTNNPILDLVNPRAIEVSHRNRSVCAIATNLGGKMELRCHDIDDFGKSWKLPEPSLLSNLAAVDNIALDWVTGNWYFLDNMMIVMCNPEMVHCTNILDGDGNVQPRGMALDPTKGLLFFTNWGHGPAAVIKSNLDGTEKITLVSYKVVYPYGIALDLANQHVYWVDNYLNYVERVDYLGAKRHSIRRAVNSQASITSIYGIAMFENMIYVTQLNKDPIYALDKYESDVKLLTNGTTAPLGLAIFHRQRQPEVAHPCRQNNGDCEHICVPHFKSSVAVAKCICAQGYQLTGKGKCVFRNQTTYLLYASQRNRYIKGISIEEGNSTQTLVPIMNLGLVIQLDFSAKDGLIFFSSLSPITGDFMVEKQLLNGTGREVIVQVAHTIESFAYDWIGDNLYVATGSLISVIELKNPKNRKDILQQKYDIIKSLVLDPESGLMFYYSVREMSIWSIWMDGSNQKHVIVAQDSPQFKYDLALDLKTKMIYWADASTIYRTNYNGTLPVEKISMEMESLISWSLFNNALYLSYNNSLWSMDIDPVLFKIKSKRPIYSESSVVEAMKVYDHGAQQGTNQCANSSTCPSMCLSTPVGFTCACPNGYSLNASGTACLVKKPVVQAPVECAKSEFQCKNKMSCIELSLLCDGHPDCDDSSDESYEADGPCDKNDRFKCDLSTHFQCDGDRCIKNETLCDGIFHCGDHSDESPLVCKNITCGENQFQCKVIGMCIPLVWVCDGNMDCGPSDESDEENCKRECVEFQCANDNCINYENTCDGVDDCGDNSDEIGCSDGCAPNEFYCSITGCLKLDQKCDGIVDCPDASDETNCKNVTIPTDNKKYKPVICSNHEFGCISSGECIPKHFQCDGEPDCGDHSDELNCEGHLHHHPNHTLICEPPDRPCKINNQCIKIDKLCDGRSDCPDGSDEGFRCQEKQCDYKNDCSHTCHNTPEGYICSCPPTMYLDKDSRTCTREHACEQWGSCSQKCVQDGKKYRCECNKGYMLQYDKFSCKSTNIDSPYIIFNSRQEIHGIDLKTLAVKNFHTFLRNTIALDFYYNNGTTQIFWSDVIDDKIYRGFLVGDSLTSVEAVVQSGLSTAEGLAVDWIGENLYWTDSNLDQIEVAKLNGSFRRTLIAGDMMSPRAVALDSRVGLLFWTDWDHEMPRIERCSMAGEDRQIVIDVASYQGAWPNGLTLDHSLNRIYWIDAFSDSIHTTDYNGKDHHLVIKDQETLSHPFGITLFENNVYWTDWRTNSVIRANKWNGSDLEVIHRTATQPFGIEILHSSRQPKGQGNPCLKSPCSHLCIINTNQTYRCECPHMMSLLPKDNNTCVPIEQVLLYISGQEIRGVDLQNTNHYTIPTISHRTLVLGPTKIDFVVSENRIFWTDISLHEIKSSGMITGPINTILDTDIPSPNGFAIDWIAKVMFVATGKESHRILASNLNGEFITEIHTDLGKVPSIAVDPINGQMYFSHTEQGNSHKIEKSALDGSNRNIVHTCEKSPDSLTIDFDTKRLYFVHASMGAIYYLDLVSNKVLNVLPVNLRQYVSSVTVYKESIYYAENMDNTIRKCSKDQCLSSEIIRNGTSPITEMKMFYPQSQQGTSLCSKDRNGCQHLCLTTSQSSRKCMCSIGFIRNPTDETKCDAQQDFLFYSLSYELKGIPMYDDLQKYNYTIERMLPPIPRITLASSIDYHAASGFLFWADSERGTITKAKRDGTNRQIIVNLEHLPDSNVEAPTGLAIDWVADNLYWSDEKRGVIEVSRLDGTKRYVVASNLNKPKKLAIDPITGYLFYIGDKHIGRIGLDGSLPFLLYNQSAPDGNLFLDFNNQVVYWCESTTGKVKKADYDGNQLTVVIPEGLNNPVAIAVFNKRLFIAESITMRSTIKVVLLEDTKALFTIANESSHMRDLKMFTPSFQNGSNPCASNPCSELCLFNGTHPVCACSHGKLSKDRKTCEPYDKFLLFSKVTQIESIHVTDHTDLNEPIRKIQNGTFLKNAIALAYDYKRSGVFYSDIHWHSINWVQFDGSDHRVMVSRMAGVEGLAFDQLTDTLFWTSNVNTSICSLSVAKAFENPKNSTSLVKSIIRLKANDRPRGIAVESCMAMVYWTNWNQFAASIQRAYISGFGVESIITTNIRMPNAITLDYEAHKLYWADARLDKIERADYDGSHRVLLSHSTPKHPFAMAIYGDLLFWTDWILQGVVRANKYSGSDVVHLRVGITRPMGIVVVQNTTQDCDADPCKKLNGGCEDHCTVDRSGKVMCICTHGRLAPDGRRCLSNGPSRCVKGKDFECSDGGCIPYELACNGVANCADESDEHESLCVNHVCLESFHQCNNRRCIPNIKVCDGEEDCGDGSDELDCPCPLSSFRCDNGQCIDVEFQCDGMSDCRDKSDEMGCTEKECDFTFGDHLPGLEKYEFIHCENSSDCYLSTWRCDGQADCIDESDEKNCSVPVCGPDNFQCGNGLCIDAKSRCDSFDDCEDGELGGVSSDEKDCNKECGPKLFVCKNDSACIPRHWECDGRPDCKDESDEGPQCQNRNCSDSHFHCTSTGRCIPFLWVCDGNKDCQNGEDEEDCDEMCSPFSFYCKTGQCIEMHFVCDGHMDCDDGSDELTGCSPGPFGPVSCGPGLYRCDNQMCIQKNLTCNGHDDCGDNSDESLQMCATLPPFCSGPSNFLCDTGSCINESQLCDRQNDCGDYSDEKLCNINECELDPKICQHECKDKKIGYDCVCKEGYKRNKESYHICDDVDECEDRPCSQICINTKGSYHCACADGFHSHGKHDCKSKDDEQVRLIVSNRYYIREYDLSGHMTILVNNLSNAVALDYDWETKCYFWSDVTSVLSSIKKWCPMRENKTEVLHHALLQNPDGLAVDWVARNLYWCDKGLDTIEVSTLDGKYRRVLIHKNLQEPRAIVLHPLLKVMFWTDWGDFPHIGKAGMDGTNPKIIVQDNLGWPNALTISFETNELFWGDAREDYIAVSDLDGRRRKIIVSRSKNPDLFLGHIFAVAVWENRIYWTDWENKSINYCNKYHGTNCSVFAELTQRPMDLRVVHPFRQTQLSRNLCQTAGCSTLCLLSPEAPGYKCMCPDNFYLDKDNKTCIANCTSGQFQCKTTYKCIPFYWRCDTQNDCGDNSDEPPDCPPFSCEPGQFECKNQKCIHPSLLCDGANNCLDNSDEQNCDSFTCFNTHFKCGRSGNMSGHCIENAKRCDDKIDCPNGEDEDNCPPKSCSPFQFACGNRKCIPNTWVCDNDTDCDDGKDEKDCNLRGCQEGDFKCKSGRCIPKSWLCDGEMDCPDNEDELYNCESVQTKCPDTQYQCPNSKCIPLRWKCDGANDCGDGADEFNCKMRNCTAAEFRCGDGKCINDSLKCDGEIDCEDKSDELNCKRICKPNEFQCASDSTCIDREKKCDGDDDCLDGSDELHCTCNKDEFHCNNGRCIEKSLKCDGWDDCHDSSDEDFELCKKSHCQATAFRCKNRKCVSKTHVCDGKDDCGDGSDEEKSSCKELNKCPPDHFQCKGNNACLPKQFVCDDFPNCVDGEDEKNCKSSVCDFGACSQVCIHKKDHGTFGTKMPACHCRQGYKKDPLDHKLCTASGREPYLLIATENEVRFMRPRKPDASSILGFTLPQYSKIISFDVLTTPEELYIFWIDAHNYLFHKLNTKLFGLHSEDERMKRDSDDGVIIVHGIGKPISLAVDWVTKRLYFIDIKLFAIMSVSMDGKNVTPIVSTGQHPQDLTVDAKSRTVFWTTKTRHGIMAVGMDGSDKRAIIREDIEWPTSICIDYSTDRLYWVDIRKETIETSLLNGDDRRVVYQFKDREAKPKKIDVFEDFIYVALTNQSIVKMNKFGKDVSFVKLRGHYRSAELVLEHVIKQDLNISNPCEKNPCNETAVCLLSPVHPLRRECACPLDTEKVNGYTETTMCAPKAARCDLLCNSGTCVVVKGEQKCSCPEMYTGKSCEIFRCSGFCKNKGVCYVNLLAKEGEGGLSPLKCNCPPLWTGERCEISVMTCRKLCHNGASCSVEGNVTKCHCAEGYHGDYCEHCHDMVCQNGGVCRKTDRNNSGCDCPDGFTGRMCENDTCKGYCSENGVCVVGVTGPICVCNAGYSGSRCEIRSCEKCYNGGTCIPGNPPKCACLNRFSGDFCEFDRCEDDGDSAPIECNQTPCGRSYCKNGGTCFKRNNENLCACRDGFTGRFCEKDYKAPEILCQNLCENRGECRIDIKTNAPICDCIGEWSGDRCEIPPDCVNGCGFCRPGSSINECKCSDGNVEPCQQESSRNIALKDETEKASAVLVTLIVIMVLLILGISAVGTFILFMRKRRIGQPFSHARLAENVEITNPMYLGDADDGPVFVQDHEDKGHFANPVYESMYAGSSDQTGLNSNGGAGLSGMGPGTEMEQLGPHKNSNAPEEKKGLLQDSDHNSQDLL